jgi:SAM-dependent methyltransferase
MMPRIGGFMSRLLDHQDAYGHAMCDHFRGKAEQVIIERDDGYITTDVPLHVYFDSPAKWTPVERRAFRQVRGRVLDVGCGAGRVTLAAQEQGLTAVGIDNSPQAVKTSHLRGVSTAHVQSIADAHRLRGKFDTIVMYGNNFGLFGGMERGRRLLRQFHKITSPQARILATSTDPYQTANADHLSYHRLNRRRGRLAGQLRLRIRYRKFCGPWMDYLLASRDEMREIVKGTGWRLVRFYNGITPAYVGLMEKENS